MTKEQLLETLIENGKKLGHLAEDNTATIFENLLDIIVNQCGRVSGILEVFKDRPTHESEARIEPFIWQIQSLVDVLKEKVNSDDFVAASDIVYNINKYENEKI